MEADPMIVLPKLSREWMNAWVAVDLDTCERILDADFVLSSARGVLMDRQKWLEMAAGPFAGESFEWLEMIVRPYGNFAIVHSKTFQKASVNGEDWSGTFLLTDVWIQRNTGWKVLSRHGTGPIRD